MAVSALDASTVQVLREQLEALDGVERVIFDEGTPAVWVHCDPEVNPSVLNAAIDASLKKAGIDRGAANLHLLADLGERRRVKFVGIERTAERNGHVRMRVGLEWAGEVKYGEAVGESGDLIELRTSAAAALNALGRVRDEDLGIKLVGVKQVRAFDVELMVVALYRPGDTPQRFVGSVAIGDQPRRAAAVAVLNALNRVLGNYLIVRE